MGQAGDCKGSAPVRQRRLIFVGGHPSSEAVGALAS